MWGRAFLSAFGPAFFHLLFWGLLCLYVLFTSKSGAGNEMGAAGVLYFAFVGILCTAAVYIISLLIFGFAGVSAKLFWWTNAVALLGIPLVLGGTALTIIIFEWICKLFHIS